MRLVLNLIGSALLAAAVVCIVLAIAAVAQPQRELAIILNFQQGTFYAALAIALAVLGSALTRGE